MLTGARDPLGSGATRARRSDRCCHRLQGPPMADSGHRRRPTVRGLPYQTDTPSLAYRAPMLEALVAGALAGYAIAVPMGPITILILQTGLRHGLRIALAAAAGAASADGLYATLAGLFGAALISVIQPVIVPA